MNAFVPSVPGKAAPAEAGRSRVALFLGHLVSRAFAKRRGRRLHLCEMLSLGEKRFVAVIEYGQEKFLLSGTAQNISLLQRLDPGGESDPEEPGRGKDRE